jgi:uncharacterized protein (DUF2235 family)
LPQRRQTGFFNVKRIAIFCDGTWNSPTIAETTHVHELFEATETTPAQRPAYFSGVGTGRGNFGAVRNFVSKYGGGAFGWGLNRRIKEAYAFCAEHYEPGDEIFIFGFSRGAYTARSLAGMIRKCGFPDEVTKRSVRRAFWLYKQPGPNNGPDVPHIWANRREMSPRFATSQTDLDRRGDDGSVLVKIAYLGIWDTVGAMGIPTRLAGGLSNLVNFRHQFHDLELSSLIRSARHALSLDEQRELYPPTPWTNLNRLSRGSGFDAAAATDAARPYQQLWFIGDHGTVGGSGHDQKPLSAITLAWIAEGARNAGLTFDPDKPLPSVAPDALADVSIYSNGDFNPADPGPLASPRKGDLGPRHAFEIDASVRARMDARPDYRPPNLP